LQDPRVHVRKSELTHTAIIKKLDFKLKESLDNNVRNLHDELVIKKLEELKLI